MLNVDGRSVAGCTRNVYMGVLDMLIGVLDMLIGVLEL